MAADDVTTTNDEAFSLPECVAGGIALAAVALIAFVGLPRARSQISSLVGPQALATNSRPAAPSGTSASSDAIRGDSTTCLLQASNSDDGCSLRSKVVRKRQSDRRLTQPQLAPTHLAKRPL
jgi:hypothetical protein